MASNFSIPIEQIVDLLGLERSPRNRPGSRSFKVHCPFCNHKGYTMDVDTTLDVYHCFHCPEDIQKNTGALDLYSRVRFGHGLRREESKEVFKQLCGELGVKSSVPQKSSFTVLRDSNIYPADDKALNKAYSALLALEYLKLSNQHLENLAARGLPRYEACQKGFASLPPSAILIANHPEGKKVEDWYTRNGINQFKKRLPAMSTVSKNDIVAGLLIAGDLVNQGIDLRGVPGFYHLTPQTWAYRYDCGMLIPTVSYEGNIVGIQTRRDTVLKSGVRYMTLSSKGLPDGVTSGISRTHVCRSQRTISENTSVYLTEGPLKAEVILWLLCQEGLNDDVAVIAVQGVNNINELPMIAGKLKKDGVRRIQSAFDMDKCCNPAVATASRKIKQIFNAEQIAVDVLCWDQEYALQKREDLSHLAGLNKISFQWSDNPFFDIARLSQQLSKAKIEYNTLYENGMRIKEHWRKETKGLDDYLNYISKLGPSL